MIFKNNIHPLLQLYLFVIFSVVHKRKTGVVPDILFSCVAIKPAGFTSDANKRKPLEDLKNHKPDQDSH